MIVFIPIERCTLRENATTATTNLVETNPPPTAHILKEMLTAEINAWLAISNGKTKEIQNEIRFDI